MKKQIAMAIGLAVISAPAFATKARLEALGEDAYGSQFISDNRNIFLNAATVNYHKDMVTFEWGSTEGSGTTSYNGTDFSQADTTGLPAPAAAQITGTTTDQDTAANAKAEGGFLKASGNMVYGIHFGSESDTANALRSLAMGDDAVHEENNIDLFVGGDAGVQWGANLTYTSTENEQGGADISQQSLRTRLGAISGNIAGFANINLENKAENGDLEFDGKSGYDLGVTYSMNDMYYMARYRHFSGEDAESEEFAASQTWVGAAKAYRLNDRSNVWVSAWYKMNNSENDFTFGTNIDAVATGERKDNFIPVTIASEVEVKDWLVLRGSVGQTIWGTSEDDDGDEVTINDTFVNAGASLIFGDFQVDGLIGTSNDAGTAGTELGNSTAGGNGTLRSDALLSRVSMLYKF